MRNLRFSSTKRSRYIEPPSSHYLQFIVLCLSIGTHIHKESWCSLVLTDLVEEEESGKADPLWSSSFMAQKLIRRFWCYTIATWRSVQVECILNGTHHLCTVIIEPPLPMYALSHAEVAKSIKIDEGAIAQKPLLQEGMFVLLVLSTRYSSYAYYYQLLPQKLEDLSKSRKVWLKRNHY